MYRSIQYAYSASNESGATGSDQNGGKGPLTCSGGTYLKLFPTEHCESFSECKKVDSGPFQGAYECPGESSLIVPPELLCPDRSFKGINGDCNAVVADKPLTCGPDVNGIPQISCGNEPECDPGMTSQASDVGKSQIYEKGPWKFGYQIVEQKGLVLNNMVAGSQGVFGSVTVPHFMIQFGNSQSKIVRFDTTDCKSTTVLKVNSPKDGTDTLSWTFVKKFNEPDLNGTLRITYDYLIGWKARNTCEYFGADCYRFIPKVSFDWSGTNPESLSKFAAFYKFDYGLVGVALTKDSNNIFGNTFVNTGRQEIQTKEIKFNAVTNNNEGQYDSIHTAHKGQTVVTPGCRTLPYMSWWMSFPAFDCVHIHWRWSGTGVMYKGTPILNWGITPNIDVMVEPSTDEPIADDKRGEPYLVPDQTIDISIVKYNEGEDDPDDPSSLVNGETIATTPIEMVPTGSGTVQQQSLDVLESAEHIVVWYATSVTNKNSDTFFRHGIYLTDPKEVYKVKTTSSLPQSLQKLDIDLGSSRISNELSESSKKMQQDILTHLNNAITDSSWVADGSRLSPDTGEKVFVELSQAASLAQKIKMQQGSQVSDSMDLATSAMLSIIEHVVLNEMKNDTDYIVQVSSNVPMNDKSNSIAGSLLAKNEALKLAVQYYNLAVREPDLSNFPQIIDNFRLSWLNTIKGMDEVSSQIGITPPSSHANTTTPSSKVNSTVGQLSPSQPSSMPPPVSGPGNTTSNTGGKTQQGMIDLSGIWSANDGGTYYITQIGNIVWWLGMSGNNGDSFTNIFRGTIKDNKIDGAWTDVPKGATRNHGTLILNITDNFSNGTQLHRFDQTGGFGGSVWTMREGESISNGTTVESTKSTPSPTTQSQQVSKSANLLDFIDYQNPDFRLAMKYPTSWTKQENLDNVIFTSPAESQQDKYLESLYIYHTGNIPLFQNADETLKKNVQAAIDFRKSFKDYQLLSSDNTSLNGTPAGRIVYTYTDPNIGDVKAMEIIAVDGTDKYNIVFIANTDQYPSSLPMAQKIVDSIQILPEDSKVTTESNKNTITKDDTPLGSGTGSKGTDNSLVGTQTANLQGFNVADETAKIKADEYQFYNFEINPDIPTAQLAGSYKEKSGNDVALTLYEISSCNAPVSSADFDIATCKEIHSETNPSGNVHLQLPHGKYYLILGSADQIHDLKVIVRLDVTNK